MRNTKNCLIVILLIIPFFSYDIRSVSLEFRETFQTSLPLSGESKSSSSTTASQYQGHSPIFIDGNTNFTDTAAAESWPGDGSAADPYVIDGLVITGPSNALLIEILNTDVHFQITNCLLTEGQYGLFLVNITHGQFISNTIANNDYGFRLGASENNTFVNNAITNNEWDGMWLLKSPNNSLTNNTIADNGQRGIFLNESPNNILLNNHLTNNGLDIDGVLAERWQTAVTNNTVNGKELIYWENVTGATVPNEAGQVILTNCTNVELTGLTLDSAFVGVVAAYCSELSIHANTLTNNYWGISTYYSENSTFANNMIANNTSTGFYSAHSDHNVLSSNSFVNNELFGMELMVIQNVTVIDNLFTAGNYGIDCSAVTNALIANNAFADNGYGVRLTSSKSNALTNNTITNSRWDGVWLSSQSENNTLTSNTIANNGWRGVRIHNSENNTLKSNIIANNSVFGGIAFLNSPNNSIIDNIFMNDGLHIEGSSVSESVQATVTNNTANGKELIYWESMIGGTVPNDAGAVVLVDCDGVEVAGQTLMNSTHGILAVHCSQLDLRDNFVANNSNSGIYLYYSRESTLANNTSVNNVQGFDLRYSEENIITDNTAANNSNHGLIFVESHNNTITDNTAANCSESGIYLFNSDYNTLLGNTAANNDEGIFLAYCENTNVTGNTLTSSLFHGLFLQRSMNSTIVDNSFTKHGLFVEANTPAEALQATVTGNTVNGKELIYWQSTIGGTVPSGAGQVILSNCTAVEVTGQILSNTNVGIQAVYCSQLELHSNTGANNTYGIYLYSSENCSLADNTFVNSSDYGIYANWAVNSTFTGNTITNSSINGIYLSNSPNCTTTDNTFINNGLGIYGSQLTDYLQTAVTNNTVNGKELIFWQNVIGGTVSSEAGQVVLINCTAVEVANQALMNIYYGLYGRYCSKLDLHDNIFANNGFGIYLFQSGNSTLTGNTASNNQRFGIYIGNSANSTLSGNTVRDNPERGIFITSSDNSTLSRNTVANNTEEGIFLTNSVNANVTGNVVVTNGEDGISLSSSVDDSLVTRNDLRDNNPNGTAQARDDGTNNTVEYNFWAEWTSPDANTDGIVDQPYSLEGDSNNQDSRPLTAPSHFSGLAITHPHDNEILTGTITIRWTLVDTLEHQVTYDVSYSADGGTSWTSLIEGLLATQYDWDTTTVANGSEYRLQVIATCPEGFTLTYTTSSASLFSVQNAPAPVTATTTSSEEAPPEDENPAIMIAVIATILAVIAGTGLFRRRRRRRRKK